MTEREAYEDGYQWGFAMGQNNGHTRSILDRILRRNYPPPMPLPRAIPTDEILRQQQQDGYNVGIRVAAFLTLKGALK